MDHKFAYNAAGTLCACVSFTCLHITQVNGYISDQGCTTLLSKKPQDFCEIESRLHLSKSQLGYSEQPKVCTKKYIYIAQVTVARGLMFHVVDFISLEMWMSILLVLCTQVSKPSVFQDCGD